MMPVKMLREKEGLRGKCGRDHHTPFQPKPRNPKNAIADYLSG